MARNKLNWKRIAPFVVCCTFAIIAIAKVWNAEYIHAAIGGALALIYLVLGLKGVTEIAAPLSESTSEVGEFLGGSENGQDL